MNDCGERNPTASWSGLFRYDDYTQPNITSNDNMVDSSDHMSRSLKPIVFRFQETFEDGSIYVGISSGDHRYRYLELADWRSSFWNFLGESVVFTVYKEGPKMRLEIHSGKLLQIFREILGNSFVGTGLDVLLLLKHSAALGSKRREFRRSTTSTDSNTIRHVELLLDGFLSDPNPFRGLFLDDLIDSGYLDTIWWHNLLRSQTKSHIDLLENSIDYDGFKSTDVDSTRNSWSDSLAINQSESLMCTEASNTQTLSACGCDQNLFESENSEALNRSKNELWDSIRCQDIVRFRRILTDDRWACVPSLYRTKDRMHFDEYQFNHHIWDMDVTCAWQRMNAGLSRIDEALLFRKPGPLKLSLLMGAVIRGHAPLVECLFDFNLDFDFTAEINVALSVAATHNFPEIVRILLREGADATDALLRLKQIKDRFYFYSPVTKEVHEILTHADSVANTHLGLLHKEFRREHRRILKLSVSMQLVARDTKVAKDMNETWKQGFRLFRKLSTGRTSFSVDDVIAFLIIVKSICTVEDSNNPAYQINMKMFRGDLHRWMVLFCESVEDQRTFCDMVDLLWNVEVSPEDIQNVHDQQPEKLIRMLTAKIRQLFITVTYNGHDPDGLLADQENWRKNRLGNDDSAKRSTCQDGSPDNPKSRDLELGRSGASSPMSVSKKQESALPPGLPPDTGSVLIWQCVICGAIFSIFLMTVLVISHLASETSSYAGVGYLVAKATVMAALVDDALEHVFNVLKSNALLTTVQTAKFYDAAKNAVRSCHVYDYSSLMLWLEEHINGYCDTPVARKWTQEFGVYWNSVYIVQTTCRIVESLLGDGFSASPIPHTFMLSPPSSSPGLSKDALCGTENGLDAELEPDTRRYTTANSEFDSVQDTVTPSSGSVSLGSQSPATGSTLPATLLSTRRRVCNSCGKSCSTTSNLNKHIKDKHIGRRFLCSFDGCSKEFSRKAYLQVHLNKKHGDLVTKP